MIQGMRVILFALIWLATVAPALAQTAVQRATQAEERALEAKLERQLEAIVGPGKARVTVSGEGETPAQTRSRSYSKPQIGQERVLTESRTTTTDTGERSEQTQTRRDTNMVYDQQEELRSRQPGGLSRRSVSVIFEAPAAGEEAEAGPQVDAAMIEELVGAGGGIDRKRGDQLHVQQVKIDTSAYDRLKAEMEKANAQSPWLLFALIGLGGAGAGTGLGVLLMRRRKPEPPQWEQPVWPQATMPNQPLPAGNPLAAGPQGPVVQIRPQD